MFPRIDVRSDIREPVDQLVAATAKLFGRHGDAGFRLLSYRSITRDVAAR
jgi:hypothetical protein